MTVTVLDVVRARGAVAVDGVISGAEFERLGLPMLAGCQRCHATLGPGNACPSRTGYIQCDDCLEGSTLGFSIVAEFEAWAGLEEEGEES